MFVHLLNLSSLWNSGQGMKGKENEESSEGSEFKYDIYDTL
jgi:hypothetical protein